VRYVLSLLVHTDVRSFVDGGLMLGAAEFNREVGS
jgi:hypothetical protein